MRIDSFPSIKHYFAKCGLAVRKLITAAAIVVIIAISPFVTISRAQQSGGNLDRVTDLAAQNLSRVSASPAEIKAVLLKDAGLLVELKRWVAKDATSHAQIVSDSDLTNDAIFDRLETDVQFRSVATAMLQRFGYLLPKLNPDSDAAKDRELLVQERTKWIAQRQEEDLAQARQRNSRVRQELGTCDPAIGQDCDPQSRSMPASNPVQGSPQNGQDSETQGQPNPQNSPDSTGNPNMRAQLMQTGEDFTLESGQVLSADPNGISIAPSNYSSSMLENLSTESMRPPSDRTSRSPGSGGNQEGNGAGDGLLAAYGNGMGINTQSGTSMDSGRTIVRETNSSALPANSQPLPMQSTYQRPAAAVVPPPPDMLRKQSPYSDIPSLYDMYVQALMRPVNPKRFGADLFENSTRDPQLIPMDLPVGPEYVVGPGDALSVDLWGAISQRLNRVVDHEGRVSLPEVGPILVSGKSLAAVQQTVQQILRTQFQNVSADVSLARLRTIRVYEVGDLARPGAYDISSLSTPLSALFVAGGPTQRGSMRILKHFRGTQLIQTVDVYDLLLHGVKIDLQRLENGDTVQVPPIGPQVTVEGMVRRPAVYELRDETTLASVLELAGGLLSTATLRHIEVQRIVAHEKQTMLSVDISDADNAAEVTKKLEAFEVHEGDRIRIYPIAPYNQDAIYLEGHVVRPGRYSFRSNMRLTDVISSYKDLLPEPAIHYAEIIRLNPPDFHPSVERVDLAESLENPSESPILQAMDTIRIFSRFDFENPPNISVLGDVRAPGTYRTSGQIHLTDAIHLAGGLTPDAQTSDAQVFRYLPDGKFKIFSVNLRRALAGDAAENIVMETRDRLLIHRNPDAAEQATVYVQGEVVTPGRYPLTTCMRVADLVRVGGGLKPSADTQLADLTLYQWRQTKDQAKLTGEQKPVAVSAALADDSSANVPLHNGDVLTIRQLSGWNDLGASIALKGEVKHPGPYGIRPGERLSSVLERAGGFQSDAYPYGAILQRAEVRELESKAQAEILTRVRDAQDNLELLPETDGKQKEAKAVALQQAQASIEQLSASPVLGRVTIRISSEIDRWKNTAADIEVRAGDTLIVPKRPSYVVVSGQVFNPTAVSFRPGKSAHWYLSQSGGPTQLGNKKAIFVIRADGSVTGAKQGMWTGDSLSAALQPGDTVVVPEKAIAGGPQWQSVLLTAQTASAIASAVFIAARY